MNVFLVLYSCMFHNLSWRSQGHEWLRSIVYAVETLWRSQGHKWFSPIMNTVDNVLEISRT